MLVGLLSRRRHKFLYLHIVEDCHIRSEPDVIDPSSDGNDDDDDKPLVPGDFPNKSMLVPDSDSDEDDNDDHNNCDENALSADDVQASTGCPRYQSEPSRQ